MSRLSPDTMLSIELGSICSRNRYISEPGPVIAELLATAGDRVEILQQSVGSWVGYYEDACTLILATALRELPGLEPWITIGIERRAIPDHRTPGPPRDRLSSAAWPRG